jgi:2-succinyl-6-hydroxy-2,4-cyclohexadiene-1-carboxylate synthase
VTDSGATERPEEHRASGKLGTSGTLATLACGSGEPVVLLHGFTQNSLCWGDFAGALDTGGRRLVAVDLPGHGRSSALRAGLFDAAQMVTDTCGPADYVGYSLGGRILLHLCVSRPEIVRRAVLIGATAGIDTEEERSARVRADEMLARQLDDAGDDKTALSDFLRRWLAGPLFAQLSEEAACFTQRLRNDAAGLASSLRLCGTGVQEPLWSRLHQIAVPVLILAGENDERFSTLARRMAASIGENATVAVVPGAGHACHLEKPADTAEIIERFWSGT